MITAGSCKLRIASWELRAAELETQSPGRASCGIVLAHRKQTERFASPPDLQSSDSIRSILSGPDPRNPSCVPSHRIPTNSNAQKFQEHGFQYLGHGYRVLRRNSG
ncbi:hypothetical protein M5D96_005510 [Drosophila gunungcola]|uniref:Uncharacterized protein n=1 Tax=Drosophila gunungcola TaxID=103775 RepID=A0A9Q0BRL8_9MUSC|nr:hypothetical protein M5D96_005510 [Drosophila gunungcola]